MYKEATEVATANEQYDTLKAAAAETILDDRNERPGIKFNDSELIGIPYRITVGKRIGEGIVELKKRGCDDVQELTIDEAIEFLRTEVNK